MPLNVDFSLLHNAVKQMGAHEFQTNFRIKHEEKPLDPIDIELAKGIEVDLKDVDLTTGLLAYEGRQVLLYIPDHGKYLQKVLDGENTGNKYHVTFCQKLEEMQNKGRYNRYAVTNELNGNFSITGYRKSNTIEGPFSVKLQVCKYCLSRLNYKGYQENKSDKMYRNFSLQEFFTTYSSFFLVLPSHIAGSSDDDGKYTTDWSLISDSYRAKRGFRCESCSLDLSGHRRLLHTHHRNGIKSDNRIENLQALCIDCHRKQAFHEKVFVPHDIMKTINRLRREQSIIAGPTNWDRVFKMADPGMHGILHSCRSRGKPCPEVAHPLKGNSRDAALELAWPSLKWGVAISDGDIEAARAQGWTVWSMRDVAKKMEQR